MMILPLADALQNCLQDLTSRIAGIDTEMMTNRGLGMGAAIGYSLGTIKEQFNTPKTSNSQNTNSGNSSGSGFSGIVSRAKNIINPTSQKNDYTRNINPIRNKEVSLPKSNNENSKNISTGNSNSKKNITGNVIKTGVKATKGYLSIGSKMAEGNWNTNKNTKNINTNIQQTEYINKITNSKELEQNSGDEDVS